MTHRHNKAMYKTKPHAWLLLTWPCGLYYADRLQVARALLVTRKVLPRSHEPIRFDVTTNLIRSCDLGRNSRVTSDLQSMVCSIIYNSDSQRLCSRLPPTSYHQLYKLEY